VTWHLAAVATFEQLSTLPVWLPCQSTFALMCNSPRWSFISNKLNLKHVGFEWRFGSIIPMETIAVDMLVRDIEPRMTAAAKDDS
jgi:hypothetical protein